VLFDYHETGGGPTEERFADLDELDQLARRFPYYAYLLPDVTGSDLRFYERYGAGVRIGTEVVERTGLRPADYIVAIEGRRPAGIHSWVRAFLLSEVGSNLDLSVVRDDQVRHIEVLVSSFSD
jgi:hypothetical protein